MTITDHNMDERHFETGPEHYNDYIVGEILSYKERHSQDTEALGCAAITK